MPFFDRRLIQGCITKSAGVLSGRRLRRPSAAALKCSRSHAGRGWRRLFQGDRHCQRLQHLYLRAPLQPAVHDLHLIWRACGRLAAPSARLAPAAAVRGRSRGTASAAAPLPARAACELPVPEAPNDVRAWPAARRPGSPNFLLNTLIAGLTADVGPDSSHIIIQSAGPDPDNSLNTIVGVLVDGRAIWRTYLHACCRG